jgi:hypothetical protein
MMRREVVSAIRLERMHGVDSSGVMEAAMGCVDKTAGMGPARIRAMDSEARRGEATGSPWMSTCGTRMVDDA